ncbi:response regulator [Nostocoides sp. F2B08]|uniref:response regulator n=1 Tax=Nostocoides sp. F2B08 TaxID=2653936 RepID=UPI001262B154|nr:response regulator transcription factor [Tetrasphaera sp. F2B08]KAB7745243.1 response regulator [Tetrasphaera sp. F2B08]
MTVTVLVADDEPLVIGAITAILATGESAIDVVATAEDGQEAIDAIRVHRPQVALLDIRMPRLTGPEVVAAVTSDPALSGVRCVMLTTFADDHHLASSIFAGATGYLLKSMPPDQIRAGVHQAAAGQMPVAPAVIQRLVTQHAASVAAGEHRLRRLTPRERDVLTRIANGRSNAEIARELYVSEGTVKTHVAAILHKLGLRDRTQAAIAAYELGLVRPGAHPYTVAGEGSEVLMMCRPAETAAHRVRRILPTCRLLSSSSWAARTCSMG